MLLNIILPPFNLIPYPITVVQLGGGMTHSYSATNFLSAEDKEIEDMIRDLPEGSGMKGKPPNRMMARFPCPGISIMEHNSPIYDE